MRSSFSVDRNKKPRKDVRDFLRGFFVSLSNQQIFLFSLTFVDETIRISEFRCIR